MSLRVAVCITTHNRRDDLARTLAALRTLDPPPDDIVVVADGCTDGTAEWLRSAHAAVKLIVHERARGSISSRNEMVVATTDEIVLSLDDDSYPIERDFIARLRTLFAEHPRLAVASFPQRTDEFPKTLTAVDFGPSKFVGSFANSGAGIRKSVFGKLDFYPYFFFHAYEEPDFALRCCAAGWQVRYITSLTIRHHFTGAQRDEMRTHQRHARNELWSVLLRCPAPQLFAVLAFRAARQLGYACTRGLDWVLREPRWWLAFLAGIPDCLCERQPLPWPRYLAWMRLLRSPIADEAEWTKRFGTREE
jgi:GT2 family glycosyltransferase